MRNQDSRRRWIDPRFAALTLDQRGPFIRLSNDRLMAVDGNATVTSCDGGTTWSEPQPIFVTERCEVPESGLGIPSSSGQLLRTRSDTLLLVWKDPKELNWDAEAGDIGPGSRGDGWSIRSVDGGTTWIDRQRIYAGVIGHPPINMIQTSSGRIVVSLQPMIPNPGRNAVLTYSSADDGATWRPSNLIDLGGQGHHGGGFEPTFIQLKNGRLWMLIRSNLDRFWQAYSDDDGLYWRTIEPSPIEASTSPGYLTRLDSGRIVLAWNRLYPEGKQTFPRRSGQFSEVLASWHREELSLSFSEDEGDTWTKPIMVVREKDTWISYPYVFEPKAGTIWLMTRQGGLSVQAQESDLLQQ